MKIKVSKVFAEFINKTAKEMNFCVSAKVIELTENMYRFHVDSNIFNAYDYNDVNENTGKFKVIILTYPANYYAVPNYLTTYQLTKEFRRRNITDVDGLKNMIRNLCEV